MPEKGRVMGADDQTASGPYALPGYVVLSAEDFRQFMRRAAAGEDPDLLYAEFYANSDQEEVPGA
jgi:hypothetical protein